MPAAPAQPHWPHLTAKERSRALKAAADLLNCLQSLTDRGEQVVTRLLDAREFVEYEHYPPDDVRDDANASQYYFHAHGGEGRDFVEHGHVHLFVHAEKLGMRRADPRYAPAPAHLVAVSLSSQGLPTGFFTVNRWVTKGPWLSARDCERGLDHFRIGGRKGSKAVNGFLRALLDLYRQPLQGLLRERDEALQRLGAGRDRRRVFADTRIEVLSHLPIDLMSDLAALEAAA